MLSVSGHGHNHFTYTQFTRPIAIIMKSKHNSALSPTPGNCIYVCSLYVLFLVDRMFPQTCHMIQMRKSRGVSRATCEPNRASTLQQPFQAAPAVAEVVYRVHHKSFPRFREWRIEIFVHSVCFSRAAEHFTIQLSEPRQNSFWRTLYIITKLRLTRKERRPDN